MGNWGFLVDNNTNKLLKLHSLMNYNKAFLSCDKLLGTRCHAADDRLSQREAAEKAIKTIGLNQIKEVDPDWFDDEKIKEMFFQRLNFLKSIEKNNG